MQGEYRMLIATPNGRLNYSLLIYRRNWHMISVLTWSQQQKCSPCSTWVVDNEEKFSSYRCSVAFMNEPLSKQPKKTKILGYKDTLFRL